ncbi:MAG: hypothetical protein QM730_13400 [Anaerolineales bacterium]
MNEWKRSKLPATLTKPLHGYGWKANSSKWNIMISADLPIICSAITSFTHFKVEEMERLFFLTKRDEDFLLRWLLDNFESFFGMKRWLKDNKVAFSLQVEKLT